MYTNIDIEFGSPHVSQVLTEFITSIVDISSSTEGVAYTSSSIIVLFYPLYHVSESFTRVKPSVNELLPLL